MISFRPDSFANVEHKWIPEIKRFERRAKIVLVGLKSDLRFPKNQNKIDFDQKYVDPDEGKKLAKKIGAKIYLECSAKTQVGLHEVFDAAIKAVLMPHIAKNRRKLKCTLM